MTVEQLDDLADLSAAPVEAQPMGKTKPWWKHAE